MQRNGVHPRKLHSPASLLSVLRQEGCSDQNFEKKLDEFQKTKNYIKAMFVEYKLNEFDAIALKALKHKGYELRREHNYPNEQILKEH